MFELLLQLDRAVFLFFNRSIANPVFDIFFVTITNGRFWIAPGIALCLWCIYKKRLAALPVILYGIICFSLTDSITFRILKPLFGRHRPCHPQYFIDGGRFLLGFKRTLSFPSNHAANAFGFAMLFSLMFPKYWLWFFIPAFLVSFSRVYTGYHWPLDVLGGALVGSVIGASVFGVSRLIAKMAEKRRQSQTNCKLC